MFGQFPERCLVFGELAATEYGSIVAYRQQMGRTITVQDAQIAAIAVAHGLRLATRNTKGFELVTELQTISPWTLET